MNINKATDKRKIINITVITNKTKIMKEKKVIVMFWFLMSNMIAYYRFLHN